MEGFRITAYFEVSTVGRPLAFACTYTTSFKLLTGGRAFDETRSVGDVNKYGQFDSADFVSVFQAGTYVRNAQAARGALADQVASFANLADDSHRKSVLMTCVNLYTG